MKSRTVCSILPCLVALSVTAAQQVAPLPAVEAAYAKHGNKFYVYGGRLTLSSTDTNAQTGQFFALDLSKPWTSDTPAWIALQPGPKKYHASAAISMDGKTMIVFPGLDSTAHIYSFSSETWTISRHPFNRALTDVFPVTLPTDGTAMVVAGFGSSNTHDQFDKYSFDRDWIVSTVPIPEYGTNGTDYLPARGFYKAGWSKALSSAVFYGGLATRPNAQWVSLYDPAKNLWRSLKTTGVNTATSVDHCVAINDDGTQLFSYGGRVDGLGTYRSNIYILNLMSGIWTEGANSLAARAFSTCTVAGDYFLLWGGLNDVSSIVDAGKSSSPVLMYQISRNAWVQAYQPSAEYLEPEKPIPSSPVPTTPSPDAPAPPETPANIGAIAGGVCGGLVVLALIGFLFWRRRRSAAAAAAAAGPDDGHIPYGSGDKYEYQPAPQSVEVTHKPFDHYHHSNNGGDYYALQPTLSAAPSMTPSMTPIGSRSAALAIAAAQPPWGTSSGSSPHSDTVDQVWIGTPTTTSNSPHTMVVNQSTSSLGMMSPRNPQSAELGAYSGSRHGSPEMTIKVPQQQSEVAW